MVEEEGGGRRRRFSLSSQQLALLLLSLSFFLCFSVVSPRAISDSDLLEESVANSSSSVASLNASSSLVKPKEGSFADIIDRALEKEFNESDQNEDASWINQDSKIGVGWTLHDSLGRYILQGSASLEPTQSVLEAEALALREALIHLKRLNYQNVTFCGDSYSLYGYLEGNMHKKLQIRGPSEIQAYLQDISKLAHDSYQFRFINRAANVLADTLAREARINDSPYVISWVL